MSHGRAVWLARQGPRATYYPRWSPAVERLESVTQAGVTGLALGRGRIDVPGAKLVRIPEHFHPVARPDVAVGLAFLELMQPDLLAAADALAAGGCRTLRIVPVFLGQGGHVREDLPAAVEAVRARHPGLDIELRLAIGEDDAVLDQIVITALAGLPK